MIYNKEFIESLENIFSKKNIKITSSNIILPCPWCEHDSINKSNHFHCFIGINDPVFRCFKSNCNQKGHINKLIKKIGLIKNENYINEDKLKSYNIDITKPKINKKNNFTIPLIDENIFSKKSLYMKNRLKFMNIDIKNIPGLIFDLNKFLNENNIKIPDDKYNLFYYLSKNFIGFLTDHKSKIILRNIDSSSEFKHYKFQLYETEFLDYYKIPGFNSLSKKIILAEGIFDILVESIFDTLNLRKDTLLYACALSSSYEELIKSIMFYENIYYMDLIILSDNNIEKWYYKNLKKKLGHVLNSLTVFYNNKGKDFASEIVYPQKFIF